MPARPVVHTPEALDAAAQRMRERDRANCRRQYWKDPEKSRQRRRDYVAAHREQTRRNQRKAELVRRSKTEAYQARLLKRRQAQQAERLRCYAAYGGAICRCCGEEELAFLAIDHIEENGAVHRREVHGSRALYTWLIKNKFPPGFQILCHNCNYAKSHGGCPHQARLEAELDRLDVAVAVA